MPVNRVKLVLQYYTIICQIQQQQDEISGYLATSIFKIQKS